MGGLSLGSSNAENWGIGVTITIRNLCMNNSVEALIWFNEEHLGLLKLHAHLGWGVPVWREGGGGRGLRYVALHQGSPVSAGFYYRILIFGI